MNLVARAVRALGLAVVVALMPAQAAAGSALHAETDSAWGRLRADDLRLATLAERLAVANAALCSRQIPATGLVLHALDQYPVDQRAAARAAFAFPAPLAVEAVIAGSGAERAGLRAGDGLLAINGQAINTDPLPPRPDTRRRDAALDLIEQAPPDQPIRLDVLRGADRLTLMLTPRPACRVRAELLTDGATVAHADGRLLQVSSALLDRFDDEGLVVVVAHELAHVVLRHGDQLAAAGVRRGFFGEFGRSARLAHATEDEADRYSVRLLVNAGYDSGLGSRFWQGAGRSLDAGLLRDATHSPPSRRARIMAEEAARLAPARTTPAIP